MSLNKAGNLTDEEETQQLFFLVTQNPQFSLTRRSGLCVYVIDARCLNCATGNSSHSVRLMLSF